ncbi:hypothetical protein ACQ4LE_008158 [Meloidogyne hapla]
MIRKSFLSTFLLLILISSFILLTTEVTLFSDGIGKNSSFNNVLSTPNAASAVLIRQCSCIEESICINSIKSLVKDCFDNCWAQDDQIKAISTNPEQLKKCFTRNITLLDKFISCLKKTRQTCVNIKNGPQIPRANLEKLLGAGERRLKSQAQSFMHEMGLENQKLVQSAVNIGMCVKGCLIQRDTKDSCFDHSGCHPKLEEQLIAPIIKRCGRKIGWKKDLGEICDCVTNAGFNSVKPYCMILHGHSTK